LKKEAVDELLQKNNYQIRSQKLVGCQIFYRGDCKMD
jgi:hypothetical protein